MVKEYVVLVIILGGLFSGCIGNESITGKYVYDKDPKLYFILYEDGTFNEWFEGGSSGSGTYRYEKNRLFLTNLPFGNVDVFTKNGTSFEYEGKGGGRYVKE
jgi:restriction endonuclease S subunit